MLYEKLNLSKDCTSEQIKSAYKKLALFYHPDKNPNGTEQFKDVSFAYSILIDPIKRTRYDKQGDNSLEESDLFQEGVDFFKSMFNEVNKNSINDQLINQYNSDTELKDITNQITSNNGNIKRFFNDTIGAEQDQFDRQIKLIEDLKTKNCFNEKVKANIDKSIASLRLEQIKENKKTKKQSKENANKNAKDKKFEQLELELLQRKKDRKNNFLESLEERYGNLKGDEVIDFGKNDSSIVEQDLIGVKKQKRKK